MSNPFEKYFQATERQNDKINRMTPNWEVPASSPFVPFDTSLDARYSELSKPYTPDPTLKSAGDLLVDAAASALKIPTIVGGVAVGAADLALSTASKPFEWAMDAGHAVRPDLIPEPMDVGYGYIAKGLHDTIGYRPEEAKAFIDEKLFSDARKIQEKEYQSGYTAAEDKAFQDSWVSNYQAQIANLQKAGATEQQLKDFNTGFDKQYQEAATQRADKYQTSWNKPLSENIDIIGHGFDNLLENPSLALGGAIESGGYLLPSMLVARGVLALEKAAKVAKLGAGGVGAIQPLHRFAAAGVSEGSVAGTVSLEQMRSQMPDGIAGGKELLGALGVAASTGLIGAGFGKAASKVGIGDIDSVGLGRAASQVAAMKLPALARPVGAVAHESAEEFSQTFGESIIPNVTMGKDPLEGLGQELPLGTLAGAIMGAGMNAPSLVGGGFSDISSGLGKVKEAASLKSFDTLSNPEHKNYNPAQAFNIQLKNLESADETVRTQAEASVSKLETDLNTARASVEKRINSIQTTLKAMPTSDQTTDAQKLEIEALGKEYTDLKTKSDKLTEHLIGFIDAQVTAQEHKDVKQGTQFTEEQAKADIATLTQPQTSTVMTVGDTQIPVQVEGDPKVLADGIEKVIVNYTDAEGNVKKEVVPTSSLASVESTDTTAQQQALDRVTRHFSKYSNDDLDLLASSPVLTESQRNSLRVLSKSKRELAAVQDPSQVFDNILNGYKGKTIQESHRGLNQYTDMVNTAVATKNPQLASLALDGLGAFTDDHTAKKDVINEAFGLVQNGTYKEVQVVRTQDGTWGMVPFTAQEVRAGKNAAGANYLSKEALNKVGGLNIHVNSDKPTGGRAVGTITQINNETQLIQDRFDALSGVAESFVGVTPKPVDTSTAPTVDAPIVTEPSDTTAPVVTPVPKAPVQSGVPATPVTPTETIETVADSGQQLSSLTKTASNTVKLPSDYGQSDIFKAVPLFKKENPTGIIAFRVNSKRTLLESLKDANAIGNPFNWQNPKIGVGNATKMFDEWLRTGKHTDHVEAPQATEEYRQAILSKLKENPTAKILYYKELNGASHANVLEHIAKGMQQTTTPTETSVEDVPTSKDEASKALGRLKTTFAIMGTPTVDEVTSEQIKQWKYLNNSVTTGIGGRSRTQSGIDAINADIAKVESYLATKVTKTPTPSQDTPEDTEDTGKDNKADLILPIGTSGSGKSTWIKSVNSEGDYTVISLDDLRVELTGDVDNKTSDEAVYAEAIKRAVDAVKVGKQVIFDTTNLKKDRRAAIIDAIRKAKPNANIQYKLLPLDPALAKQRIKDALASGEARANVDDAAIDRHAKAYVQALEDIKQEGITAFPEIVDSNKIGLALQGYTNHSGGAYGATQAPTQTTENTGKDTTEVGFKLTPTGQYTSKDQLKADKATKFIGEGAANSSTAQYAKDAGDKANTGKYTKNDVVFISVNGARANRQAPNLVEIQKAIDAGATILTDKLSDRERSFNVGEREVAAHLTKNGYVEEGNTGVWKPEAKTTDTTPPTSAEVIYGGLNKSKTITGNVIKDLWNNLKDATKAITPRGVISTRIKNSNEHFGNPFSSTVAGLIKTKTTQESVVRYLEWVLSETTTIKPEQHAWIREQLKLGALKGKSIIYYTELGEPSHANALDYLINDHVWESQSATPEEGETSTESHVEPVATEDAKVTVLQGVTDEIREEERNKPFSIRNMIRAYFTQDTTEDEQKGNNPLVLIKDFILQSDLLTNVSKYLSEKTKSRVTDAHIAQLKDFQEFHAKFSKVVMRVLHDDRSKVSKDNLVRELLNQENPEDLGTLDENVLTAISLAAYGYLIRFGNTVYNTDDVIRSIVRLKKDQELPSEVAQILRYAGHEAPIVEQQLGEQISKSLALKAMKDSSATLQNRLDVSFGNLVTAALHDVGYIELDDTSISPKVVGELLRHAGYAGNEDSGTQEESDGLVAQHALEKLSKLTFIRPNYYKDPKGQELKLQTPDMIARKSKDTYSLLAPERDDTGDFYIKKLVWGTDLKQTSSTDIMNIIGLAKPTAGFLSKLMGVDVGFTVPTTTEPESIEGNTKQGTNNTVPKQQQKLVKEGQVKAKFSIRANTVNALNALKSLSEDSKLLKQLLGVWYDDDVKARTHIRDRDSVEAKNKSEWDILERGLDWAGQISLGNDEYLDFYDTQYVSQNERMQYLSNFFNMQSSQLHRAMASLSAFKLDISLEDLTLSNENLTRFYQAVGEGLEGLDDVLQASIKKRAGLQQFFTVDKVSADNYVEALQEYLKSDESVKAIDAMVSVLRGNKPSEAEQASIAQFVEHGDMGIQSLQSLIALAEMQIAVLDGKSSFTTTVGLGSDGVNNGVASANILTGVISRDMKQQVGMLAKGQVKTMQEAFLRGLPDYYISFGIAMGKALKAVRERKSTTVNNTKWHDALQELFPVYKAIEIASLEMRKVAKTWSIPFNYGAGKKSLQRALGRGFLDGIYKEMTSISNKALEAKANLKSGKITKEAYTLIQEDLKLKANTLELRINTILQRARIKKDSKGEVISINGKNQYLPRYSIKFPTDLTHLNEYTFGNALEQNGYDYFSMNRDTAQLVEQLLLDAVNAIHGTAAWEATQEYAEKYTKIRDVLNTSNTAAFMLYNGMRTKLIQAKLNQKEDALLGTIRTWNDQVNEHNKEIISRLGALKAPKSPEWRKDTISTTELKAEHKYLGLTTEEMREIDDILAPINPTLHSALSQETGDLKSGIALATQETAIQKAEPSKQVETKYLNKYIRTEKGFASMRPVLRGLKDKLEVTSGIKSLAMAIQGIDAYVAAYLQAKFPTLNVHDAGIFGLKYFREATKYQNEIYLQAMTTYHLNVEHAEALVRSYLGLKDFIASLDSLNLSPEAKELFIKEAGYAMDDVLNGVAERNADGTVKTKKVMENMFNEETGEMEQREITIEIRTGIYKGLTEALGKLLGYEFDELTDIDSALKLWVSLAISKDLDKLESLKDIKSVHQYSGEGGEFTIGAKGDLEFSEHMRRIEEQRIALLVRKKELLEQIDRAGTELNLETGSSTRQSQLSKLFVANKGKGIDALAVVAILKSDKSASRSSEQHQRQLQILRAIEPFLKGVKVVYKDMENSEAEGITDRVRGFFEPKTNTIVIRANVIKSDDLALIVHEMLHAALSSRIEAIKSSNNKDSAEYKALAQLEDLRTQLLDNEVLPVNGNEFLALKAKVEKSGGVKAYDNAKEAIKNNKEYQQAVANKQSIKDSLEQANTQLAELNTKFTETQNKLESSKDNSLTLNRVSSERSALKDELRAEQAALQESLVSIAKEQITLRQQVKALHTSIKQANKEIEALIGKDKQIMQDVRTYHEMRNTLKDTVFVVQGGGKLSALKLVEMLEDVHEFISYGLTETTLQDIMQDVFEVPKGNRKPLSLRGAWKVFISAVGRILRMPNTKTLNALTAFSMDVADLLNAIGTVTPVVASNNGERRYSKNTSSGNGLTVASVRQILVKQFGEKLIKALEAKGLLRIVETMAQTPEAALESGTEGYYHNGQATLVAAGLTAKTVVATLLHELIGHKGFQELMGPAAYNALMKQFNKLVAEGNPIALAALKRAQEATGSDGKPLSLQGQMDEYLPYLLTIQAAINATQAQKSAIAKFIDNVFRAVRAWAYKKLQANGYEGAASTFMQPQDIVYMAERMLREIANSSVTNGNPQSSIKFSTQSAEDLVNQQSSLDIMTALPHSNTGAFNQQLDRLIVGEIGQLYNQDDAAKARIDEIQTFTASDALNAGFTLSRKEQYVQQALQYAVAAYMKLHAGGANVGQLNRVYHAAKAKMDATGKDFYEGDWATATQQEKDIAKAKYDFLFDSTKEGYMSRFVSMALASEAVNKLLDIALPLTKPDTQDKTWFEKVNDWVSYVMAWLTNKYVRLNPVAGASNQLSQLMDNLVKLDIRNRQEGVAFHQKAWNTIGLVTTPLNKALKGAGGAVLSGVGLRNSRFLPVRALGAILVLRSEEAAKAIPKMIIDMRNNQLPNTKLGEVANILLEASGVGTLRDKFDVLIRQTNLNAKNRQDIVDGVKKAVNKWFKTPLTKAQNKAIAYGLLGTDAQALLENYSVEDIVKMALHEGKLNAEIAKLKKEIAKNPNGNDMLNAAEQLGYYMVTRIGGEGLVKNATGIAIGLGTQYFTPVEQADPKLVGQLNTLVSMLAMTHVPNSDKAILAALYKTDAEGIHATIQLHQGLVNDSLKDFQANPLNMVKGWMPEVTNPYLEIKAASEAERPQMLKEGWKEIGKLKRDPEDFHSRPKYLMKHNDIGYQRLVSGAVDLGSTARSGTEAISRTSPDYLGITQARYQNAARRAAIPNSSFDPSKQPRGLIAAYDTDGGALAYNYEMDNETRDAHLDRKHDIGDLLGTFGGLNYYKPEKAKQSNKVAEVLFEDYKANYSQNPNAYLKISHKSTDPKVVDMWRMLPQDFKQRATELYGKGNPIIIRNEAFNLAFGFKKFSVVSYAFDAVKAERERIKKGLDATGKSPNKFQSGFVRFAGTISNFKAGVKGLTGGSSISTPQADFAKAEHVVQEIVKAIKDFIVIRSGTTMMWNIFANVLMLMANGINPVTIIKDWVFAVTNVRAYQKLNSQLIQAQADLAGGKDPIALKQRIGALKAELKANVMNPYINAGLFSSIVDDVNIQHGEYTYASAFKQTVDEKTRWIPKPVKTAAAVLTIAPSTKLYQFLATTTQLSDFVAKYSMSKHLQANGTDIDASIIEASKTFVNYDVPTSQGLQYANDMGLFMFTKFFLRIQAVLMKLLGKRAGSTIAQHLLVESLTGAEGILSPIAYGHIDNIGIESSVLGLPSAFFGIGTINAVTDFGVPF